jgi:glycosyltransferase involved in cell wall biosynthesis
MIIHDYLPHVGGAERQLAALAPLLIERGVAVTVLTRGKLGLPRRERIRGVDVHRAPLLPGKPLASLAYTVATLGALRRLQPDLLHVYGLFSTATTALLAARFLDAPILVKLLRGGPGLGDIDRLRQKLFGAARLGRIRRQVDGFVAITPDLGNELLEIGIPPERCHVIPNGVDSERFRPASEQERRALRAGLDLAPEAPLAVFSGRLESEKRVDRLLRLWPRLRRDHPDATLLVVGDGREAPALQAAAPAGVRFAGAVDDIENYLRAADVFALPSIAEGLSNALLEALATGLPAVVSDLPGNRRLVTHDMDGLLVPVDDEPGLEDALGRLLGAPDLRARLGSAARQKIERDFALAATADRLVDLYRDLLQRRQTMPDSAAAGYPADA